MHALTVTIASDHCCDWRGLYTNLTNILAMKMIAANCCCYYQLQPTWWLRCLALMVFHLVMFSWARTRTKNTCSTKITRWQWYVPECIKDDSAWVDGKGTIRPPLPQKTLNRWSLNYRRWWRCRGPLLLCTRNFMTIRYGVFCFPPPAPRLESDSAIVNFWFFLFSTAKTPAPIFTINIRHMTVVSRRDVPIGGPEEILRFCPYFLQNPLILRANFDGTSKFSAQKCLNKIWRP